MQQTTASAVHWSCRAAAALQLAGGVLERFAGGIAAALLGPEQMRSVTARIYDTLPAQAQDLFEWERSWFARDLPAPPARILVGGCGRGREARTLLSQGYEVWAFDPSLESIRECERSNPKLRFTGCFGYEDLIHSLSDPTLCDRRLLPGGVCFDAVLLGWGSFTHVIEEPAQQALLCALDGIASKGPILASCYVAQALAEASGSRAFRSGRSLGRRLSGARGLASLPRVRLLSRAGFVYFFDEARLQVLAYACNRRLELHIGDGLPHATFHPPPL